MQRIHIVHEKVKGRGRYDIPGLKRSVPFKQALEFRLMANDCFTRVCASAATGRVLLEYTCRRDRVLELMRAAVKEIQEQGIESVLAEVNAAAKEKPCMAGSLEKLKALVQAGKGLIPWHTRSANETLDHFQSDVGLGIDGDSVEARRKEFGENILPRATSRSDWQIIYEQFNSLPVYLLGAAAGISVITGGLLDAVVILGVVAANAAIGYVTESRAEKNIDALNDLVLHMAEVIRDGRSVYLTAEEVVPGDILMLRPGSYVPADCRLIRTSQLTIDESMLTGESLPVSKHAKPLADAATALADRKNMAYMGTCITGGQGTAVVIATGENTEIGRLKMLLDDTISPQTPIERQLEQMGDQLVVMCMAICGGVFGLGLFMGFGFLNMLRTSISLAAAAVPEGLPAAATVNFAMGINRMKKDHIIVRHLQAVETLGAVQTICLDKTGTITQNKMKVSSLFVGSQWMQLQNNQLTAQGLEIQHGVNEELTMLLQVCAMCAETKINGVCSDGRLDISGSATESALTELVDLAGINVKTTRKAFPLLETIHRSEKRLFMSTLHKADNKRKLLLVKGSPLEVLGNSSSFMDNSITREMTGEMKEQVSRSNETMAKEGQRVLGFAYRFIDETHEGEMAQDLIWLGLIGMTDPPREGIKDLIAQFHRAGVRTVMITGDQEISARSIARTLDLSGGEELTIMDAEIMDACTDEELVEAARHTHVFARVTPSHKLKIINALQAGGQTVAMTGDGINDGPALKAADIGIAMGQTGTDLARDVADVVLEKDNLELMATTLADGRSIYQNIRKSVHFFLATNISEIQLMTTALAMGMNSPLNVMQLLWINLISDIFPGLALAAEIPESDVMDQLPREADTPIFTGSDFKSMVGESTVITGGAMASLFYGMAKYGGGIKASGLAFQTLTLGQLVHAFSCRSESAGLFTDKKLPANVKLNWAIGASVAAQMLTMVFSPLRSFLGLTSITALDGLVIAGTSLAPLLINETVKAAKEQRVLLSLGDEGQDKVPAEGLDEGGMEQTATPNKNDIKIAS